MIDTKPVDLLAPHNVTIDTKHGKPDDNASGKAVQPEDKERPMPITVTAPEGVLTEAGEREILPRLSAALIEASGCALI